MAENKGKMKGKWTEESMRVAVNEVISGKMTARQAAESLHVPRSTLGDRLRLIRAGASVDLTPQMGRFKKTFDDDMEKQLVLYMKDLDNKFMPLSRKEFLNLAFALAEHLKVSHQFNKEKKTAGKQFYYDFMARHPELSLRCPESTSLQRALGFNRHQVELFFKKYEELLSKYSFSASRIHNCDETGISVVHANDIKVISQKGKKQVSKITSGERGRNVTVLLCINAAGDIFVPPLFVFPNKSRIDEVLKKDAPPGSVFAAEESGWISAKAFLKWLKLFVERTRPTKEEPVLLILDGHASHKDLDVILFARQHHVHMISLPPHTTHKLQPLDRAIMRPFKAAYNQACGVWMRKYQPLKISQKDVAGLVNTAYSSICRMDLAQSAFTCTGLWPLNPNVFTDLDFIAAEHFREPVHMDEVSTHQQNDLNFSPTTSEPGPSSAPPSKPRSSSANTSEPGSAATNTSNDFSPPRPEESIENIQEQSSSSSRVSVAPLSIPKSPFRPNSVSSTFIKVVEKISPVAKPSEVKVQKRKQRTQKSEVLTSSPYKQQLEEKKKLAEDKRQRAEKRKSERDLKTSQALNREKSGASNGSKQLNSDRPTTNRKRQKKLEFGGDNQTMEEDTKCIICRESFEEEWVQCIKCKEWAHVGCVDQESILYFIFDYCKK